MALSGALLSFKTPVCLFKIGKVIDKEAQEREELSNFSLQAFYLLDGINRRVGKIWTSARIARIPRGHDFIALSIRDEGVGLRNAVDDSYIPKRKVSPPTVIDPKSGISYPVPEREEDVSPRDWRVVNVMLVEWKDDVAFRVAIGQIISTAWATKGEEWVYLG